jgi:hypothetical protein
MIEALESNYKGICFRSRMEARWAVFMDVIEAPYYYALEGFNLGEGLCYLPDFYLPYQDSFFEIKSPLAPSDDFDKIESLVLATGKNVFTVCSPPLLSEFGHEGITMHCVIPLDLPEGKKTCGEDYDYCFCECPHCGRCEIHFNGRADRIKCDCPRSKHGDKGYNYDSPRLRMAYEKAARFRFD